MYAGPRGETTSLTRRWLIVAVAFLLVGIAFVILGGCFMIGILASQSFEMQPGAAPAPPSVARFQATLSQIAYTCFGVAGLFVVSGVAVLAWWATRPAESTTCTSHAHLPATRRLSSPVSLPTRIIID